MNFKYKVNFFSFIFFYFLGLTHSLFSSSVPNSREEIYRQEEERILAQDINKTDNSLKGTAMSMVPSSNKNSDQKENVSSSLVHTKEPIYSEREQIYHDIAASVTRQ